MKLILPLLLAASALIPAATAEPDTRLYELRTYQAPAGKLDALLTRFRDHTTALFTKHGMTNLGYWVPADNKDHLLIYLLAYPDRKSRDASWKAFLDDPAWKKAHAESEADGTLVTTITERFMSATDFSPGFDSHGGEPRLIEMRTYTTPDGRLPRLDARFRDHTLGLFKKHGITNLGYYHFAPGQRDAGRTLLYFIAHKDRAAADASWAAFRRDPVWIAAKSASEDEAGGSLTTPDGVQSLGLIPTDFSPVK